MSVEKTKIYFKYIKNNCMKINMIAQTTHPT